MEITDNLETLNICLKECPEKIISIVFNTPINSPIILDLTNCINLSILVLNNYTYPLDLTNCNNLTKIHITNNYNPLKVNLTKCINLIDLYYHGYNELYKNIPTLLKYNGNIVNNGLKNVKNKFEKQIQEQNQKILKLEEQLQNLTDIISNLKTNTSYFT